jgi:uncharacterized membrane protein
MSSNDVASASANRSQKANQQLMRAIAVIAIVGMLVSSISLYHHFSTSKTSFCTFGESFNCDLVNRSSYSTLFGLPVALIGILGYLLVLALATVYRDKAETPMILLIVSLGGFGFSLYLTYIEGFVLQAWCILCLTSLASILSVAVLSALSVTKSLRRD